ncbi:MAG TPA: Trm112 family protein [Gemmatimonadaceae bacterium]|nr:Trm112 family protein [Gemmatimonadaceae bacterium]
MHIPLVDILRCPRAHDDTWLVASIERAEARDIIEGVLGCPICSAEYPIREGVVDFGEAPAAMPYVAPREDEAVRLAAALDLTEARTVALLDGAWGAHAPLIRSMSPAQLLLVNPPEGVPSGDGISVVRGRVAPLAAGSVNAAALDAVENGEMVASVVRAVRGGGRLLGPAGASIPEGFTELVSDADVWVAGLAAGASVSAPVPLTRRPPSPSP